jgi:uncharacterized protein
VEFGTVKLILPRAITFFSTLMLSFALLSFLPSARARRQTYFARAAADGDVSRMRLLQMTGASVNSRTSCCSPLFLAAGEGRLNSVRYLLDQGADVNVRDDRGRTALTEAAFYGNAEVIKELLRRGADANAITDEGTALDISIKAKHLTLIDLLKHYGTKRACELSGSC